MLPKSLMHLAALSLTIICCWPDAHAEDATDPWPDIATLETRYANGGATVEQVVERHLARIEALNGELRAVIAVDPTALEQARALDKAREAGEATGPLFGVPAR